MKTKLIPYYDDLKFDYRQYWQTRKYEDLADKMALKKLFKLIFEKTPSIKNQGKIIDIGSGFGRLAPEYANFFKNCLLIEPSNKLLKEAKKFCQKYKNVNFQKSFVEKLPVANRSFDVALMIRVAHHLEDLEKMITEVTRVLKPGGYFILEFANKIHLKNRLKAIFHFNWRFFLEHQPENLKTKKGSNPFYNYHPNQIKTLLLSNGFKIIRCLSVSNFRHSWLKKLLPLRILLFMEELRQNLDFNCHLYLGPSIFFLAQLNNPKQSQKK